MSFPDVQYTRVGDGQVAYQVLGQGRPLLYTWGSYGNLDTSWEDPLAARFFRRLAQFCQLIRFDRRGSGLSDPRPADGGDLMAHFHQDLRAVLAACGHAQATLMGAVDAGPLLLEFAVQHPSAVSGLVLAITPACVRRQLDYPEGHAEAEVALFRQLIVEGWGRPALTQMFAPSQQQQPDAQRLAGRIQRAMATPHSVAEAFDFFCAQDARHCLPRIQVPVLAVGRSRQQMFTAAQSQLIARLAPQGQYLELPGSDLTHVHEGADTLIAAIEELLTGQRGQDAAERAVHSLLFADVVDSTRHAQRLGDAAWRNRLDALDQRMRAAIASYRGRLVDVAGDGYFCLFSSPGAALECAAEMQREAATLQLQLRCGAHIAEVELRSDGRVGGMGVHIAARVAGEAKAGEVWLSRTLRDVLLGSRYRFEDRGVHELKGVPSKWPLYAWAAG